jgi:hypothetical protein
VSIARVALDVPIDEAFDFRIPEGLEAPVGALVVVPFGRTRKVGVVVAHARRSEVPAARLRDLESVVSDVPALAPAELDLYEFCARYYQRPLGEVIAAALPPRLRQVRRRAVAPSVPQPAKAPVEAPPELTPAQRDAVATIEARAEGFHPVLLQGVTGSGKTEVYLQAIASALARGRQALFLVPEIGLTPQLESHVRNRFPQARIAAAHSHLSRASAPRRGSRRRPGLPTSCWARGSRCSCLSRAWASSSWTRSTTRRTSSRKGFAIRRATWRCGARKASASPWCWAPPRPRSKAGPTPATAATRSHRSGRAQRVPRCRASAPWTRAPTAPAKGSRGRSSRRCASAWTRASNRSCS